VISFEMLEEPRRDGAGLEGQQQALFVAMTWVRAWRGIERQEDHVHEGLAALYAILRRCVVEG